MIPKLLLTKFILPLIKKTIWAEIIPALEPEQKYVFKPNDADKGVKDLIKRVKKLEAMAHKKKEFVKCEACQCKIKEK